MRLDTTEEDYKKPKFYRPSKGNRISWEIYNWHCWSITISPGTLEIQIDKWPTKRHLVVRDNPEVSI